ncbi:hypothetical protein Scep_025266 [Stephania cephalantha]|uniref:Uncharacterized protein n=1 Tax=Stephania cephalantha TaxID=152367 RepID=A0AAP0EN64_9MAGN
MVQEMLWMPLEELCLQIKSLSLGYIRLFLMRMPYLDEWSTLECVYSSSLSGAIKALQDASVQLPISGNVKPYIPNQNRYHNNPITSPNLNAVMKRPPNHKPETYHELTKPVEPSAKSDNRFSVASIDSIDVPNFVTLTNGSPLEPVESWSAAPKPTEP